MSAENTLHAIASFLLHNVPVSAEPSAPAVMDPDSRRRAPRFAFISRWVGLGVVSALVLAAFTVPVNAVIQSPGPTWNLLSEAQVSGAPTYQVDGALRMTTVAVRGCPGYPVTVADLLRAGLSSQERVVDRESVCPRELSEEEVEKNAQAQFTSSEQAAYLAAMRYLGKEVTYTLTIAGLADGQSAELKEEDVLKALTLPSGERVAISSMEALQAALAQVSPGTKLQLAVEREGAEVSVPITTMATEEGASGSRLGVYLTISGASDAEVELKVADVGGPSAGMMVALSIVDYLTPGAMTGGKDIAGTGTVSMDGTVGPIGGIAQKLYGAADAGSSAFLAPEGNCAEVVGNTPKGLDVFAVGTLNDAVQAVEAIAAGDTSGLRSCESVLGQ